jgi:molybdopterin molybdotransferase
VRILRVPAAGQWIRRSGEDITAAARCWRAASASVPAALGLAASIGRDSCRSPARPRVALFSTGDELVMPGEVAPER